MYKGKYTISMMSTPQNPQGFPLFFVSPRNKIRSAICSKDGIRKPSATNGARKPNLQSCEFQSQDPGSRNCPPKRPIAPKRCAKHRFSFNVEFSQTLGFRLQIQTFFAGVIFLFVCLFVCLFLPPGNFTWYLLVASSPRYLNPTPPSRPVTNHFSDAQ